MMTSINPGDTGTITAPDGATPQTAHGQVVHVQPAVHTGPPWLTVDLDTPIYGLSRVFVNADRWTPDE